MKKIVNKMVSALLLLGLIGVQRPSRILAQGEVTCEADVVVQTEDWLSKIADKSLGDLLAFSVIAEATNAKAALDDSYATIEDVNIIEPGWKLCIPGLEESRLLLFEDELEFLREALQIPGLSVAVVQGDEIIFARGFGYADVERQVPATENTPYRIASVTKPIAATLMMKLVEQGKLDLDGEVAKYYPGYSRFCQQVQSLDSIFAQGYHCDSEPLTVRQHLAHMVQGTPGERFSYNPTTYNVLANVVEGISEKSFVQHMVEDILEPAHMANSAPGQDVENYGQVLDKLAKPYRVDILGNVSLSSYPRPFSLGASSGLISTALDLAKYSLALDQNLMISEESKETLFRPTLSNSGQPVPYGLGWHIQDYEGMKLLFHPGVWPGAFSSLLLKVPHKELTLVLLANSDGLWWGNPLSGSAVHRSPFAATFLNLFADMDVPLIIPGLDKRFVPVTLSEIGVSAAIPDGWTETGPGVYRRGAGPDDPTTLTFLSLLGNDPRAAVEAFIAGSGDQTAVGAAGASAAPEAESETTGQEAAVDPTDGPELAAEVVETPLQLLAEQSFGGRSWSIYLMVQNGLAQGIAATANNGNIYLVALQTPEPEFDALFDPTLPPILGVLTIEE